MDTPFTSVDVLGVGATEAMPAAWHGVISHEASLLYYMEGVDPDGSACEMDADVYFHISIGSPHNNNEIKKVRSL